MDGLFVADITYAIATGPNSSALTIEIAVRIAKAPRSKTRWWVSCHGDKNVASRSPDGETRVERGGVAPDTTAMAVCREAFEVTSDPREKRKKQLRNGRSSSPVVRAKLMLTLHERTRPVADLQKPGQ